jgi:hypothetical protein
MQVNGLKRETQTRDWKYNHWSHMPFLGDWIYLGSDEPLKGMV